MYIEKEGEYNSDYTNDFIPYLDRIGIEPLHDNTNFKELLKEAGISQKMKEVQDEFFDKIYWNPAYNWFVNNKFTFPLSMLVVYDSFIHSGSILMTLRKKFPEYLPVKGGKEKVWIQSYTNSRHQWLKYHLKPILRKTIYRTQLFLDLIGKDNWNLDKPIKVNNSITVA
jgi:chitosanase